MGKTKELRVLIVDDESSIAEVLKYALTTDGFQAVWVTKVEDALVEIARGSIDFVILDVGLPDRSGFDLLKEIRLTRPRLPVLMLTARAGEVDRILGLEFGADDYVVKPFSPREVVARIRAILRRLEGAREEEVGTPHPDFVIDEPRFRVSYQGHDLALSRYEYRVLTVLIRRPGWVFSRERLMELCWEEPEMSMDRTVDTHVKTLRAKLREVTPDIDPIVTHRGIGYSLREPQSR